MTKPTQTEIEAALDVLRRASGPAAPTSLAQVAKMTDAELDAAGITPEAMLRMAAEQGADPIPGSDS